MKLSTKIILPIILISALLILLTGCKTGTGTVLPDESPGYTAGTITGIIAAPCCTTTSADIVSNPPADWCCLTNTDISCKKDFFLQDNIEVILTYGVDEVATTTTNEKGEYTFTEVPPVKNYVITVFCPDNDKLLVKDVATEVVEGKIFDAEITDWVSTSLGLVVDYLVDNTTVLGPENIELDDVIADKCAFIHFPAFRTLVRRVRSVGENCGNLNTDDDVQVALCKAAQEVGRIVIPDLDLGCYAGYTNLTPTTYTLTMAVNPTEGGTTNPAIGPHSGYTSGTTANISAVANEGYQFDSWTGSTVADSNFPSTTILMNSSKSVTANFTKEKVTLTMAVVGSGTTDPVIGTHTYDYGAVVDIEAIAAVGSLFTGWSTNVNIDDDTAAITTVTMYGDQTAEANFALKNIITFITLEGWNNAGCNPGFGSPHEPFSYSESKPDPEPYEIEPDIAWLTITNPNLKSVHFFINIATDPNPIVTYKYTTNTIQNEADTKIWSSSSTVGTLTGPDSNGEYTFSSTCLVIPGNPSTSDYPHHFYINIDVNGINSYMVHIW